MSNRDTAYSSWPALATWLRSAAAQDAVDTAPVTLSAQANGVPVDATTLFPIGATDVTFAFRDASGNTGVATSTVTVSVGTPRIEVALVGLRGLEGRKRFVDLSVTNVGTGIARRTAMIVMALKSKHARLLSVHTPMPRPAGDLNPGDSRIARTEIVVPASVHELLLVEARAFLNVKGQPGIFTGLQTFKP